jgi:hypothetical protein
MFASYKKARASKKRSRVSNLSNRKRKQQEDTTNEESQLKARKTAIDQANTVSSLRVYDTGILRWRIV